MSNALKPRCTSCWACRTTIEVPKVDGEYIFDFKCGWCGAITNSKPISAKGRHGLLLPSSKGSCTHNFMDCISSTSQLTAVAFVICLLSTIIIVGIVGLLPQAFLSISALFWNRFIAVILAINILLNYVLAATQSSKSAHNRLPQIQGGTVPKGVYENYRYCTVCQTVKAPDVHHCSVCNACIDEMDHHCPFIGNCVGKRNLRNFLLFLFWTSVGTLYAMIVCIKLIIKALPLIEKQEKKSHHSFSIWNIGSIFSDSLPWWTLASFYIFTICFAGGVGVILLLSTQLYSIWKGQTFIEQLKGPSVSIPRTDTVMMRFARVFGGKNPCLWLLPFPNERIVYETVDWKVR